jgi:vitamin B12 transporter
MPISRPLWACLLLSPLAVSAAETIVITAGRIAQDAPLTPVGVIGREEIEQSAPQDAAELLSRQAGLNLTRSGGPGQNVSLFMRGTESNHTLVLIDGVKLNPGTLGYPALQNLAPEMIERIEIARGPYSSLYGSEAIGGVAQIFTRRAPARDGLSSRLNFSAGSHATYQAGGGLGWREGRHYAALDANWLDSEGFSPRRDSEQNAGHDNLNLHVLAGTEIGKTGVEIMHWQAQGNTGYLDYFLTPLDQDFSNRVTALTARQAFSANWRGTLRASLMADEIDQKQSADFAHTERREVDWQNDFLAGEHHRPTFGLVASWEDTASSVFGTAYEADTPSRAVYLQDDMEYGPHHLLIASRYTWHGDFGGHTTGNLAYGFQLAPATQLLASAGTAFRAPDSTDRFGYGGNPALDPETSRHLEFGLRQQFDAFHSLQLAVFQTRLNDLIQFEDPDGYLGPLEGRNQNIARARIRGLEADFRVIHGPWAMRLGGAWLNPRDQDSGRLLARRSRTQLNAQISYDASVWRVGASLNALGKRRDSDFSDDWLAAYATVDLTGEYRFTRQWRIYAKVVNLFDRAYQPAGGYRGEELAGTLGVRWNDR